MITPPTTGVKAVDAELRRRAPFASTEAAEAMAAKLLSVWRTLQPYSDGSGADRKQQR